MNAQIAALLAQPDVRKLLAALDAAGGVGRIVGGAVRDAVMGRAPGDIDIATPLEPRPVMELAKAKGWKVAPTGLDHGTVMVIIDGRPFEVTTLRRDVETDGRRAVVAFTKDFREDAYRRDFTLNALSLDADGVVHDYATGIADAKAGIIRFMGDAETRIREDYLRILRFFRFQASHGSGSPEPAALAACAALKHGMARLSRERVRQELLKLLAAPGAQAAADAMAAIGLWAEVLPGVAVDISAFRRWCRIGRLSADEPSPIGGLAALAGHGLDPDALAASLKLSRAEHALLAAITRHEKLIVRAATNHALLREAVYRIGAHAFPDALSAAAARAGIGPDDVTALASAAGPILASPPVNPFRGADAARLGVPAGPRMGRVLAAAEERWIAAGLPDDPAVTATMLQETAGTAAD